MLTGTLMVLSLLARSVGRFYQVEEIKPEKIETHTVNGNAYVHDFSKKFIENGHYTWIYLCETELREEWNRVSEFDYDGRDPHGNRIRHTLIRYMTSMGLKKDSAGLARLSMEDIRMIEQGRTNYLQGRKFSLYNKLYEVIWQVDVYRKNGNPSGHSVTQRILYLTAGWDIFRQNLWTGVGTGDVAEAYESYYEEVDSTLSLRWRLRAHNQLLTFLLTYGIFGFILIMAGFLYPVYLERKWKDYFMIMFLLVGFFSMLNEDTLETHTGVSFFAFFYALFLFAWQPKQPYQSENARPER
jgi:hypothetical protein